MTRNEELAAAFEAAAKEYEPPQTVQPCWTTARTLRAIAAVYRQAAEKEAKEAAAPRVAVGFNAIGHVGLVSTGGPHAVAPTAAFGSVPSGPNLTPNATLESERYCMSPVIW